MYTYFDKLGTRRYRAHYLAARDATIQVRLPIVVQ